MHNKLIISRLIWSGVLLFAVSGSSVLADHRRAHMHGVVNFDGDAAIREVFDENALNPNAGPK